MSLVIVCDRCQETDVLERTLINTHRTPSGWTTVDFPDFNGPTDLCSHCYKEFKTEFLGVQKRILGKK